MIVGRPSAMKSPSMKEPLDILYSPQKNLVKDYEERFKDYEAQQMIFEEYEKTTRKKINKAISS